MGLILLVIPLIIFGVGYSIGSAITRNSTDKNVRNSGGCVGGLAALVIAAAIVYAGCSQMRF